MSELPDTAELFAQSLTDFHAALPSKLSQTFKSDLSKNAMLEEVRAVCSRTQNATRLSACCTKVARFASAFEPYFDTINIFVQVKSEYMALVWGSIKLIFQLAKNHVTFLEKVANMFESLSTSLPRFQELYESCISRKGQRDSAQRLVGLLKLIYEDIVAFCGEVILTLAPRRQEPKFRHNLRLLRDTVWTTFDGRFGKLMERTKMHQELFSDEIFMQDRKWIDVQFANLEKLLQSSDTRAAALEEAALRRNAVERLHSLKSWLCTSRHNGTYEKAVRNRLHGSCDWLLKKDRYVQWRDRPFDLEVLPASTADHRSWLENVLFLQGKPGYGKTILSSAVIDDLQTTARESAMTAADRPAVAYFHFDATSSNGKTTSGDALRSLAVQLITSHQNEASLMDALSVLFDEGSIQTHASTDDVEEVIKILLQQYPTFIVLDGVDECVDHYDLLSSLSSLLMSFDCRILMFSRPEIAFPWRYKVQSKSWLAQLSTLDNQTSIARFLDEQLNQMTCEGLFGLHKPGEGLARQLATRSQGMFLWASVFIRYLRCPALSPNERCLALENNELLQDLVQLYNQILETLARTSYDRQIKVASEIFRWIAMPIFAMDSKALQTAVAITPGERTDQGQLLADWPRCVQQITCSLVEIDHEGIISFLHLSFKEFLEENSNCHARFSLRDKRRMHQFMSMTCMSHLLRDIPERPLRGLERDLSLDTNIISCGVQVRFAERLQPAEARSRIAARYPFLKYASLCWAVHLERAMAPQGPVDLNQSTPTACLGASSLSWSEYSRPARNLISEYSSDHIENPDRNRPLPRQPNNFGSLLTNRDNQMVGSHPNSMSLQAQSVSCVQPVPEWAPFLSELLIRPLLVNVWVEMCYTFAHSPNLVPLKALMHEICEHQPLNTVEGRELWWIDLGLHRLIWALEDLKRNHALLLKQNPTLIWQRHVRSAADPEFWPNWEEDQPDEHGENQREITVRTGVDPMADGMSSTAESSAAALINYL